MLRKRKTNQTLRDPKLEPFFITVDDYCFTIKEMNMNNEQKLEQMIEVAKQVLKENPNDTWVAKGLVVNPSKIAILFTMIWSGVDNNSLLYISTNVYNAA